MQRARRNRLLAVAFLLVGAGVTAALVLQALNENINLFYPPDQIVDGDAVKASTFRRYVLPPGSDLTGQPEQVVAIANAIWTPAAVAAYQTSQTSSSITQ